MKRLLTPVLIAAPFAIGVCGISKADVDPENVEVVVVEQGKLLVWQGQPGRTYFVQTSDPNEVPAGTLLQSWLWMPDLIELGAGEPIQHQIGTTADKAFFRIWHTDDQPPQGVSLEDWDPDGDGLSNYAEITTHQTNPLDWDSDHDGMPDDWEISHGLDPNDDGSTDPANGADGDPDGDGLSNEFEYWYWADPNLADTDGDGLNDYDEVFIYHTWPDVADMDCDGLSDYAEVVTYATDPWEWDTDEDTLSDGDEVLDHGTNPLEMDTDGDWMWDDWELDNNLDPTDAADGLLDADSDTLANQLEFVFLDQGYDPFTANNAAAFPWAADPDWDGITTQVEFATYVTNPRQHDTDLDGMNDAWEIAHGFNPKLNNAKTGPTNHNPNADPDGDGLTNEDESGLGTNPNDPDTDSDEVDDKTENDQGSNPNDPNYSQPPPDGAVPFNVTFGDDSGSHSEKYRVQLTPLEGDLGGVRHRTNRQYGASQTDTFHLPKGAKYQVQLIHIGSKPSYRGTPKPDYDHTLDIDTSQGCLVIDDPDSIVGTSPESGGTIFVIEGKSATLYVPLFRLKEVSFWGSTVPGWLTDDGTPNATGGIDYVTYEAPHWQDCNDDGDANDTGDRKYPIAYVRNTLPTIEGKIAVKPAGLTSVSGFSAKIKATGPGNIAIPETAAGLGADELQLPVTPSSGNFEDQVDFLNPMTLTWEVEVNGRGHWCEAGDTDHRTYVTLAIPITSYSQETIFDIACRPAAGLTDPAAITEAIWGEFGDREVRKVDPQTGTPTGPAMTYYDDYYVEFTETDKLLAYGDGQCLAWVYLFLDSRKIHRLMEPDNRHRVVPSYAEQGFLVREWDFEGSGNRNNPLMPWLNIPGDPLRNPASYNWQHAVVTDAAGLPGQSQSNPASLFERHYLAFVNGQYYDPSYGENYATLDEFDAKLAGFWIQDPIQPVSEETTGWDLNGDNDTEDTVSSAAHLFRKNDTVLDIEVDQTFPY